MFFTIVSGHLFLQLSLDDYSTSEMVRENLNCMHAARQRHIQNESWEKVRRSLRHNVRTSRDVKYVTGD